MELTGAKRGDRLEAKDIRELARVAQRSRPVGPGVFTTSGGTGHIRDDTNWFLVKITAVTGSGKDAKYSFTEQYVVSGNGAVDPSKGPGDVENWSVPRKADKDVNPARSCVAGHTFAVDEMALARRNIGAPSEFELWPSGGDWQPFRITAGTGNPYSAELVKLVQDTDTVTTGDQTGWVAVDPPVTFSTGWRMPSKDYDETILPPIPVGQVVLARPSPTFAGNWEITPWGGQKHTDIEDLYRVCVKCVVNEDGTTSLVTVHAIRMFNTQARDRRVFWMPPSTSEYGIEDNTDGHIAGLT